MLWSDCGWLGFCFIDALTVLCSCYAPGRANPPGLYAITALPVQEDSIQQTGRGLRLLSVNLHLGP